MTEIFSDFLDDRLQVFMNNFSICGNDFDSCLAHLTKILEVYVMKRLVLRWEKSYFMVREGVVLRHLISIKGLEVDKAKIEVIQYPNWDLPFKIMCNATEYALRAVLGRWIDKKPMAICYVCEALDKAQMNYTTMEKELLAVVYALENFRPYILGSKIIYLRRSCGQTTTHTIVAASSRFLFGDKRQDAERELGGRPLITYPRSRCRRHQLLIPQRGSPCHLEPRSLVCPHR